MINSSATSFAKSILRIPSKGRPTSAISHRLEAAEDETKRAVPKMFDTVHQLSGLPEPCRVAREAHIRFMESTSDETSEMESELVSMIGDLWHGRRSVGNMTSGGTESNFNALRAALRLSGRRTGSVVLPNTMHRSVLKAIDWLGLKAILVPVDEHAQAPPDRIREAVRKDTIALVATCATNPYGTIDPIEEMGRLAEEKGIYLHVDAAFGGLYCPWVERLGRPVRRFDFRVKGVRSIASDPHKAGYGVYPAGCIVYRDEETMKAASFSTEGIPLAYKSGHTTDPGLLGDRPAVGIAVAWSVFNYLGADGYLRYADICERSKDGFVRALTQVPGLEPVAESQTNLLAVMSKRFDLAPIKKKLKETGWSFGGSNGAPRTYQSNILIVFAAANEGKYEPFLDDLRALAR